MTEISQELLSIADSLDTICDEWEKTGVPDALSALESVAKEVAQAWSGSNLGYHANIYYAGLRQPPAGARFSPECGLMDTFQEETIGDWQELNPEKVIEYIYRTAGNPSLDSFKREVKKIKSIFSERQADIVSILSHSLEEKDDSFLRQIQQEVKGYMHRSTNEFTSALCSSRLVMTRDTTALSQGVKVPAHVKVLVDILSIRQSVDLCKELASSARKAGSHIGRATQRRKKSAMVGTNVFIGHGRSHLWRDLKDFLSERLGLPYDEFNRVPVAGVTNIARLSEMMDSAAIAFLVMTGEDEQGDGRLHARMNVIHEAGLFQGRLGFTRAIVLLEEGCEEFSNIQGLGQIRFPKGNIKAVFEEIRAVLEREKIIPDA